MSNLLSSLPLLACPVGMGLMMWMMSRGGNNQHSQPPQEPPMTPDQHTELTRLRAELDQLHAEDRDRDTQR